MSFKPLLAGANKPWPLEHLVVQFQGGAHGRDLPPQPYANSCVLTERWRLVKRDTFELYDIQADPAQRNDIAGEHPEVVAKLKTLYEPYWQQVKPRMTPVSIDLGNPAQNPTELCSQDWRMDTGNPPWNFRQIKKLPRVTGPWMVNVVEAGRYRLTLRQYPAVAGKPVVAERATIEIAGVTAEHPVEPGSQGVVFELDLPAGETKLLTYLYDEHGKVGGAYFTEVELIQ